MDTHQRGVAFDFPIPTQNKYQKTVLSSLPSGEQSPKLKSTFSTDKIKSSTTETPAGIRLKPKKATVFKPRFFDAKPAAASGFTEDKKTSYDQPSQSLETQQQDDDIAQRAAASSLEAHETQISAAEREQQETIQALEASLQHLEQELSLNEEELLRRRKIIEELSEHLAAVQRTTVPLEDVKATQDQMVRRGFGLYALNRTFETVRQSRILLRTGFRALVKHTFKPDPRAFFEQRRAHHYTSKLLASPQPAGTGPPAAVERTMKLLRTEQLFLMDENAKLLNEVRTLTQALHATPQKATEVFQAFANVVLPGSGIAAEAPLPKIVELKKASLSLPINAIMISRFSLAVRSVHSRVLQKTLHRWNSNIMHTKRLETLNKQRDNTVRLLVLILRQCVERVLRSGVLRLRFEARLPSRKSALRRVGVIVYPSPEGSADNASMPSNEWQTRSQLKNQTENAPPRRSDASQLHGEVPFGSDASVYFSRPALESTVFVMCPEYYSRLPSVAKWRERHRLQ